MNNLKIYILSTLLLMQISFESYSQKKEVMPSKNEFNIDVARQMLEEGGITIEGTASAKEFTDNNRFNQALGVKIFSKKHHAKPGTKVLLFPMTPYFEEYLELRKKYLKSNEHVAVLSEDAFKHRIETSVGENGKFKFEKIKPGVYYIETVVNYTGSDVYDVAVGQTDYYNGLGHYKGSKTNYKGEIQYYQNADLESKIINLKEGIKTFKVKL